MSFEIQRREERRQEAAQAYQNAMARPDQQAAERKKMWTNRASDIFGSANSDSSVLSGAGANIISPSSRSHNSGSLSATQQESARVAPAGAPSAASETRRNRLAGRGHDIFGPVVAEGPRNERSKLMSGVGASVVAPPSPATPKHVRSNSDLVSPKIGSGPMPVLANKPRGKRPSAFEVREQERHEQEANAYTGATTSHQLAVAETRHNYVVGVRGHDIFAEPDEPSPYVPSERAPDVVDKLADIRAAAVQAALNSQKAAERAARASAEALAAHRAAEQCFAAADAAEGSERVRAAMIHAN